MKKGILESQKLKGCRRVMALVLASAMIFSSSGVQTMAQEEAIEAAAEAQAAENAGTGTEETASPETNEQVNDGRLFYESIRAAVNSF